MQRYQNTNAPTKVLKVFSLTPHFRKKLHFVIIKFALTESVNESSLFYTLFCCEVLSYESKFINKITDSLCSKLASLLAGLLFCIFQNISFF